MLSSVIPASSIVYLRMSDGAGPTARDRYAALDGYRGLAACLVVLYHYNQDFQVGLDHWLPLVSRLHLVVDFFFVLSGFVVMTAYGERVHTLRGYATFLRRRIARLYPLHALTLGAFLIIGLPVAAGVMSANHPEFFALDGVPANLLLLQAWGVLKHDSFNVPSWSISAEWLAYLAFPAFALTARRLPWWANVVLFCSGVCAFTLWRNGSGLRPWTAATFDFGALRALPTFFAGVLVAAVIGRTPRSRHGLIATWPTVHATFALALVSLQLGAPDEVAIILFVCVVALAALAERSRRPTWLTSAPIQRLGAASYSIYMVHVLASIPVLFVIRATSSLNPWTGGAAGLATFLVVLWIADIVYRYYEIPWRRLISGELTDGAHSTRVHADLTASRLGS